MHPGVAALEVTPEPPLGGGPERCACVEDGLLTLLLLLVLEVAIEVVVVAGPVAEPEED